MSGRLASRMVDLETRAGGQMTTGLEVVPPRGLAALAVEPPALFLPDTKAAERFFDFFTANIRNKNTRRAYYKAACRFSQWCAGRGTARPGARQALARGGLRREFVSGAGEAHGQATSRRAANAL
jgi:hypothetical protein